MDSPVAAQQVSGGPVPIATPNDNRTPAGRRAAGTLHLSLEITRTLWRPEGAAGETIPLFAFAESGKTPTIPGPLLRVIEGTEIRIQLHNGLDRPAVIHGLHDHDGAADSVVLAAGESRSIDFRAKTPGTHFYWARTKTGGRVIGRNEDSQLVGAFVVDPRGSKQPNGERIMVITAFDDTVLTAGHPADHFQVFALNGLSWPGTERLQLTEGDTLHWRVINASDHFHPMHLHGFFFTVESHGSELQDTIYAAGDRRQAVTESLRPATGMSISWIADRPGTWLFHCHLIAHIDAALRPARTGEAASPTAGAMHSHMDDAMAGLVVALTVRERRATRPGAGDPAPRKRLRLFITERDDSSGAPVAMSYVLQRGSEPPASDSAPRPGTTLVLQQHEPTEIAVTNLTQQTTAVHWHGIELESYYDGIGGWSGGPGRLATMIAPGDSFAVRITPPRAGTYIYHTHADEMLQLRKGLFGALIVLPAGVTEPDSTDRLLMLSDAGPEASALSAEAARSTLGYTLSAGVAHRLRMVSIPGVTLLKVRLLQDSTVQTWRPMAKDGADLPASRAVEQQAEVLFGPGETMDVEIRRRGPVRLILEVTKVSLNPTVFKIPVTVR
jgi:FtsP/CotA-like multicopper oxidase with cupredoxin domain